MGADSLKVGDLKNQKNFSPLPYRRVSFQPYNGEMSKSAIESYLMGREIYRRTDVIILHNADNKIAVAAVQRKVAEDLFTHAEKIEVIALPNDCVFIKDPNTDSANRSNLANTALRHNVSCEQTAVVVGTFDHINIIHRPDPLLIRVVEVTPPDPPKLFHLAEHVLSYADLPPIRLDLAPIRLRDLCADVECEALLVPCRSGGLDEFKVPVFFLDERPEERENWTLIGCERSLQFHRHYYGDEPPRIEMCPRRLASNTNYPTLLKCCLLEFDIEQEKNTVIVPWGADLKMVEEALRQMSKHVDYA